MTRFTRVLLAGVAAAAVAAPVATAASQGSEQLVELQLARRRSWGRRRHGSHPRPRFNGLRLPPQAQHRNRIVRWERVARLERATRYRRDLSARRMSRSASRAAISRRLSPFSRSLRSRPLRLLAEAAGPVFRRA